MDKRLKVSNNFQEQLKVVFEGYTLLKDALVADNAGKAQSSAKEIGKSLDGVDMKLLENDKAHNHWMTLQKEIRASANAIAIATEIAEQRSHFKHLSAHMISTIQLFGINQTVFSNYCPMADSNNGAYWVSLEKEIRNPYYGEEMLTCGEITATLR